MESIKKPLNLVWFLYSNQALLHVDIRSVKLTLLRFVQIQDNIILDNFLAFSSTIWACLNRVSLNEEPKTFKDNFSET